LFGIRQAQKALKKHYQKKLQGAGKFGISDLAYIGSGISNYMYSFRLKHAGSGENLILRTSQNRDGLNREFRALEKLYPTSIPVPKVHDMGEEIPGFSFIIMEKVEGMEMYNALFSWPDAEKEKLIGQFARTLADINMLDWKGMEFDFLDPPEGEYGFIDRWLSRLREWCRQLQIHRLNPILDWLDANKPPSDYYVLLHEDYHPGNIIVNDGKIAAIVDWEGVSIGDPAYDVCWPLLLFRAFDPSDQWCNFVIDKFLNDYQEATGRELKNFDFYQVLKAAFFLFIITAVRVHGIKDLGLKAEVESIVYSDLSLRDCCIKIVKEKSGIDI